MPNGNPHARIDDVNLALDRATAAKIRARRVDRDWQSKLAPVGDWIEMSEMKR